MLYGLAIVVVTFGVMAAIAIPKVLAGVATLKVTMCDYRFKMLNAAIEIYKVDTGSYPDNLKQIVRDPLYFTLGEPYCVWGDVFSYNANTHRIVPHNHKRRYNWRELLDLY
jgi:type II secretory pathway pseudopilin PulG